MNTSPEKGLFQKENRLPTTIFQGICIVTSSFQGRKPFSISSNEVPFKVPQVAGTRHAFQPEAGGFRLGSTLGLANTIILTLECPCSIMNLL